MPGRSYVACREATPACTLERLLASGLCTVLCAVALTLGLIGGYEANAALGLRPDGSGSGAGLMLAEDGIRSVWCRDGSEVRSGKSCGRSSSSMPKNSMRRPSTAPPRSCVKVHSFAEIWESTGRGPLRLGRLRRIDRRLPRGARVQPLSLRGRGRHGAVLPAIG